MNKWLIRIAICGLIGGSSGWFWCSEYVFSTGKKVSDCPGGVYGVQKTVSEERAVKVYHGKWRKTYLEVIGK